MATTSKNYPSILVTFLPNKVQVKLNQWEKINVRQMALAQRAITRERNRLRVTALRAERQKSTQDEGV